MFPCMRVCAHVCRWTPMGRSEVNIRCLPCHSSALFLETGTVWHSFIQLGWPSRSFGGSICPTHPSWNYRHTPLCPAFPWMLWIQAQVLMLFAEMLYPRSRLFSPCCFIIGIMQTPHRSQTVRLESRVKFEFMICIQGQAWSGIEFI